MNVILTSHTPVWAIYCWSKHARRRLKKGIKLHYGWLLVLPFDLRTKRAPASASFWCWICLEALGFSASCTSLEVGSSVFISLFLSLYVVCVCVRALISEHSKQRPNNWRATTIWFNLFQHQDDQDAVVLIFSVNFFFWLFVHKKN